MKAIECVRQKFLDGHRKNPEHYHENDIANIKCNDWSVERFITSCKTEDEALNRLITTMQWRNEFGVNQFTDQTFPEKFYNREEWFRYGNDREGRPLLWQRAKNHYKSDKYIKEFKQFTIHQFEKLDSQVSHQGWALIIDTTAMRLSNVDTDYNKFVVDSFNHYPLAIGYVAVLNLPFILNPFAKLLLAFMGEEKRKYTKFIRKEELLNLLNLDTIPIHLGGNNSS